MKQKHFLISLAVLAIGISVDAQTKDNVKTVLGLSIYSCLLYTSPSPRDYAASRMPSSA